MDYFDYLEPETQSFDIEEFLEQSQEDQQKRLEEELERIQEQLEQRDRIHEEIIEELESKRDWYINRLELLYKRNQHGKRKELKQRIEGFYQRIREENRSHWQDRQNLEQERRKLFRQLEQISSAPALFDRIL